MDREGEEEGRLASLPESLLVHILSFLPIREAVKTMLIKPFGNLWTSLPNLDLDDSSFLWNGDETSHSHFYRFARNLLIRHSNPKILEFTINIKRKLSRIEDWNLRPEIDSWINFSLRKQVEVLNFSVCAFDGDEISYKLPHSMFICDSVIYLKLLSVEMKVQRRVQMTSLRILRLERVDISDQVFREIIGGCPLLKELEIVDCWGFSELNFDAPNVEELKLCTEQDHILRINCPNLRSFDFGGYVDHVEVVNLSSLLHLTFHLRCFNFFSEFPQFVAVLKNLVHAKVVSLSYLFSTVLFSCLVKDIPHLLFNWKRVELRIWLTDGHIPGLNRLLSNSTCLEELVIHLKSWHPSFIEVIEYKLDSYLPDEEGGWSCLKSISIHDISKSSYHLFLHLVEFLFKKALVLDELVIYYHKKSSEFTSEELKGLSQRLSTFPKASQHAKVLLIRKRKETTLSIF